MEVAEENSKVVSNDDHTLGLKDLFEKYQTNYDIANPKDSKGLSSEQHAILLKKYGLNRLPPPKTKPAWLKFLTLLIDPFMVLLEIAALLGFISYAINSEDYLSLILSGLLLVVVLATATMVYAEEKATSSLIKSLNNLVPESCQVLRDGSRKVVHPQELVPGDIVFFSVGDRIPADIRILSCIDAKVECSSITGESEPIRLTVETSKGELLESKNMAFYSSLCLHGSGQGLVVKTGAATVIGDIASLAGKAVKSKTSLEQDITRFVKFVAVLAITMATIFSIIGIIRKVPVLEVLVTGFLVVIVANVPQGLPSAVVTCLAVTANKMSKVNVLIKHLQSIETLGTTSVLASDKTGTLTKNEMTVVQICQSLNLEEAKSKSHALYDTENDKIVKLSLYGKIALLCNAAFREDPKSEVSIRSMNSFKQIHHIDEQGIVVGDATDCAIYKHMDVICVVPFIQSRFDKLLSLPFNSTNKFSAIVVKDQDVVFGSEVELSSDVAIDRKAWKVKSKEADPRNAVFVKGAPDIILDRCTHYVENGTALPITDDFKASLQKIYDRLGGNGERVLALAERTWTDEDIEMSKELDSKDQDAGSLLVNLNFVGLISLRDPPKENVRESVRTLKKAGIRVAMVTGDHPLTAGAIGRMVGILEDGKSQRELAIERGCSEDSIALDDPQLTAVVIHGHRLPSLTEKEWDAIVSKKEIVFARTTPQQKLEIVKQFQNHGEKVAVTGDGVNDAPALKTADVGVAMGNIGSDVARDAANIILLDDNFASMVSAVKMGRLVFENLQKTIAYTLSHLVPEVVPILLYLAVGFPLGLAPLQVLSIDLITEVIPAISLSFEEPENNIMRRKPRNIKKEPLVSTYIIMYSYLIAGVIISISCFSAYCFVFFREGITFDMLIDKKFWKSDSHDLILNDHKVLTADDQIDLIKQAQAAWYITLIMSQAWHIFSLRSSTKSIFQMNPFSNRLLIIGVVFEAIVVTFFVMTPGVNFIFNMKPPTPLVAVFSLFSLVMLTVANELRKISVKHHIRKHYNSKKDVEIFHPEEIEMAGKLIGETTC